jgi:mannosylglycoprotein endo-beta-mannosidase
VDLAKAFDRISWNFIAQALSKHQFSDHFISLLHACISTTSMQVLVNGKPSEFIYPTRGIRQGCPLSPYLFVIAINELSELLQT